MHSGRIVIANRSAVGLKGVLFLSSKAIKSILNHWGKKIYWYRIVQCRGGLGEHDKKILMDPHWVVFGERSIFRKNVSYKTISF